MAYLPNLQFQKINELEKVISEMDFQYFGNGEQKLLSNEEKGNTDNVFIHTSL